MKEICRIHSKSIVLEVPETLESSAKILCEKPYQIQRTEENSEVIWWGYNTNWKRNMSGQWFSLIKGEWVECDEPEYETIYKKLEY